MRLFIQFLESINRSIAAVLRYFVLLMLLIQFLVVVLRYTMGYSAVAMSESVLYLHAFIFMLAAGYTLLINSHVRVDIFYEKFSPKVKTWIDVLGCSLLLIPSLITVLYWSTPSVYNAFKIKEGALSVGGIPASWVLKLLIPLFCILLLIQCVAFILRTIFIRIQPELNTDNTMQTSTQQTHLNTPQSDTHTDK